MQKNALTVGFFVQIRLNSCGRQSNHSHPYTQNLQTTIQHSDRADGKIHIRSHGPNHNRLPSLLIHGNFMRNARWPGGGHD